jgi:polysaccharide export outer membrane protein
MSLHSTSSLVLSLLFSWATLCLPQQTSTPDSHAARTRYFLGPEDQISIHVVDLDDVSDKPVRIDPEGFIELPLVGRIHAAGLTPEQLRATLARQLSTYIDKPQITINVLEYRSQPVSILGEVNNPGLHQLEGPKRLLEVISLAGGLKPDAGQTVTITRQIRWGMLPLSGAHLDASGQYSVAEVQLDQLTSGQNPAADIEVVADDVISVSKARVVYVVGEVKKAGGFSLETHDSISLLRALSLAEGLTHDASPKKARILRSPDPSGTQVAEIPINVQEVLAGRAPDPQLHANDVLFIPNNVSGSALKRASEAALQIATGVIIFR